MPSYNRQPMRGVRLFEEIIHSPSLIALWPLNEKSGTVFDRGPNRLDGAVSGNPTYSKAITATYGLDLDGTGDYVTIGDVASLRFERTNSFSILCFVDPNISALGEIITKWAVVNPAVPGWALGINSTGTWRLVLTGAAANSLEVRSTDALINGVDKLLLVTYAGTSLATGVVMYANGVAVGMTTVVNTLASSLANAYSVYLGIQDGLTNAMNGDVGFIAVWNKVVSAEDARRYAFLAGLL